MDKAKEQLEDSLEALRALCEPVAPPKDMVDYYHYFCGANTEAFDLDELEENMPKREQLYNLSATALRAFGEVSGELQEKYHYIENNIGKEIVERTQSNPKYYEKMSALLRELIEKRKNDVINYEEYLRQIVELARKVHKPESGAEYPPEIRESAAKRAFYDHLNGDAVVANQIYDAVMSSKQDNFRGSKIKERKIWRAIRAIVKDDQEADRLLVLVKEQSEF